MAVEIKFCGLTRREDARVAADLGASYTGVIFAGGPRMLSPERAADVLANISAPMRRVGVFADQPVSELLEVASVARLDVVQLHGTFDPVRVDEIRRAFTGEIWQVVRVTGSTLPESVNQILQTANGLLLDAFLPGTLGGTGVVLPWRELADAVSAARSHAGANARLILAGGLRPENVASAIATLAPDAVDVSSGVESAPGIKDHDRMRAFRDAVLQATALERA